MKFYLFLSNFLQYMCTNRTHVHVMCGTVTISVYLFKYYLLYEVIYIYSEYIYI